MCGGGLVIKLAGAGVITLETAIGIMAGGGAAVGGGTELANQVQSGEEINPGAIATRTAFGGVKGALWGLAPELGAVGFGASIGGYSAVENLTYNATKGKTTASDSIEAIAGGLGEGIFAGIMHKASSKAASKASESVPAKPEPIKPMTEAELERVSGGAKDPGWKPDERDISPYYPTNNGAVIGTEKKVFLMMGDKIDRYGPLNGKYFAPINTPLEMRAMPGNTDLSQYRQFEVVKPFEVEMATIQPSFGKLGLGIQYHSQVTADVLLSKGIIKKIGGN